MQVMLGNTARHGALAPAQPGDAVIRAIYDEHAGVTQDIHALGYISGTRDFATLNEAITFARIYQRTVPSKQWGDQAIAILTDAAHGFALLQLNATLGEWRRPAGGAAEWWGASAFQPLRSDIVAVVDGFYALVPARGSAPVIAS